MRGIVIYAPAGEGKSLHAERLASHFGKRRVVHEWCPGKPLNGDSLALTNVPGVPGALLLADALDEAGLV